MEGDFEPAAKKQRKQLDPRNWIDIMQSMHVNVLSLNELWKKKTERLFQFGADIPWQVKKKNGSVEYALQCLFQPYYPKGYKGMNAFMDGITFKIQLVRNLDEPRVYNKWIDGMSPESSIVLSACEGDIVKKNGIFKTEGFLNTNIVKLGDSKTTFYKTFEGHNFAKLVLGAAISVLAEAKVCCKIHAAALGTKTIMEKKQRFKKYTKDSKIYILAPQNYENGFPEGWDSGWDEGSNFLREQNAEWDQIVDMGGQVFWEALESPKFIVEAPALSPYFLSL